MAAVLLYCCTAVPRRLVGPNRYFFGVRQDKVNGVEGSTVIPVGSQHSLTTPLPFAPLAPKPTHLLSSLRHTNKSSNPFISSHFAVSILHIPRISLFFLSSLRVPPSIHYYADIKRKNGCAVRGKYGIPQMLNMTNFILIYKYVSSQHGACIYHMIWKQANFKTVAMIIMMMMIFVFRLSA